MFTTYPATHILFIDIETVPQQPAHAHLNEKEKNLWELKAASLLRNSETDTAETIYERAGIYAEFGKIICISCGALQGVENNRRLLLKSFAGDDEKTLLAAFCNMLAKWAVNEPKYLCAHNGKEFDFPYICRRLLINNLPLPAMLCIAGKKPWDIPHIDTMELWKFGDYKSYTSLNLLAHVLGVPTPKDDIDGSRVAGVYYEEKNLQRIINYCQKDVITLAQIFLRMHGEALITPENMEIK